MDRGVENKKGISRRAFLRLAATAAVGGVTLMSPEPKIAKFFKKISGYFGGGHKVDNFVVDSSSPVEEHEPEPTNIKLAELAKTEGYTTIPQGTRVLVLNREKIPVGYLDYLNFDSGETRFSEEEIKNFREKREVAMDKGEPDEVRLEPEPVINLEIQLEKPKRPVTEKVPEDALSSEELKERGIEIIQTEEVQMFLREGIFDKGEILEDYYQGGEMKLIIALVDGPIMHPWFMKGNKYDKIRSFFEKTADYLDPKDLRKKSLSFWENYLADHRDELARARRNNNNEEIERQKDLIRLGKKNMWLFNYCSDDDIVEIDYMTRQDVQHEAGEYISWEKIEDNPGTLEKDTALIALSVGRSKSQRSVYEIWVDAEGGFHYDRFDYHGFMRCNRPNPDFNYLQPDDITTNQEAVERKAGYPHGGQEEKPGFALRHELIHDKETRNTGTTDEYTADTKAYDSIVKAWKMHLGGNDRKYYIGFISKKGIILTENQQNQGMPAAV